MNSPVYKIKKRIEYIDLAKGICIILVVLFHLTKLYGIEMPLGTFQNAFRMPLYFFLSGCFFKSYENYWGFLKRKINKLLVPFLFFYLVCGFLLPHLLHLLGSKQTIVPFSRFFVAFLLEEYYPDRPIWFLWTLFLLNSMFYWFYLFASRYANYYWYILLSFSLSGGVIGVYCGVSNIDLIAHIDSALSALPFFAIGYFVVQRSNLLQSNRYDKYLPITTVIAFVMVYLFGRNAWFESNYYSEGSWLTLYPCGLLGIYGVLMLSKYVKRIPVVSYFGRYSIMILVTHDPLFNLLAVIVKRLGFTGPQEMLVNFCVTMAAYWVLIPLMCRYLPYVTAQKDIIPITKKSI